jgi:hypothetical protein
MVQTKAITWRAKRRRSLVTTEKPAVSDKKSGLVAARVARVKAAREAAKSNAKASVWILAGGASKEATRKRKFGAVVVANTAPDAQTVAGNVDAGREALKRATDVLTKPGVTLRLGAHVPRFRADVSEPGMLIRELNGNEQRGRIVNGIFVPAD